MRGILGNDVRKQGALDLRDLVLQLQLALLQPLDLELVERHLFRDPGDHVVEVTVLGPQLVQPALEGLLINRFIHHRILKVVVGCNSS